MIDATPLARLYARRRLKALAAQRPDEAHLAAAVEHFGPVLLVLGLATRLGATTLLGMTVVIQVFVFPQSWPEHAVWATGLVLLQARGPGRVSVDHLIRQRLLGG